MKATHMFYFGDKSLNNKAMNPNGVPVEANVVDADGYTEWLGDDQGNIVGFTRDEEVNCFGSYVKPIK